MAKDGKKQGTEEKRKSRSFLKILLIILIPLLILGGAAYFFLWPMAQRVLGMLEQPPQAVSREEEREPQNRYCLSEFTTNLADEGGRGRFIKLVIYVGYDESSLTEELERRQPEIQDAVLDILGKKTVSELSEPGGYDLLKEEVKEKLNEMLVTGTIARVYFTERVIQ